MDPKLGPNGFRKRGVITLEPEGMNGNDENSNQQAKVTVVNDDDSFSTTELEQMIKSGWYQLKLVEDNATNNKQHKPQTPVMTTVRACQVRRSNFRYVFILFVCLLLYV